MTGHQEIIDKAVKIIGPTNKQEMAEWLAEFCGGKYYPERNDEISCQAHWEFPDNKTIWTFDGGRHLEHYFYSPDGFFAVLRGINQKLVIANHYNLMRAWVNFLMEEDMEAFYNAVYEVMK